jgi:hypothetical protein
LVETVCFDMEWSLVKEGREAGCHSGKAKPHDVRLKPWSERRKRRSGIEGQAAWRLYVPNQYSLSAGVSVYVALGGFDGPMDREQVHVAQAATRAMDIPGRHGNETAPTGMG